VDISLWLTSEPGQYERVGDWSAFFHARVNQFLEDMLEDAPIFRNAAMRLLGLSEKMTDLCVRSIRVGSETCPRVGFDLAVIRSFLSVAGRANLELDLVLPPLPEADLAGLELRDTLGALPAGSAVIANDLGTLALVHDEFPGRALAGRLLWKRKRAARFFPEELDMLSRDEVEEWRDLAYPEWVRSLGVDTVEIDLPPQGIYISGEHPIATHMPWCFVSYGRVCYIGSLGLARPDKFRISSPCEKECIGIQHVVDEGRFPGELLRRGKGVYCPSEPGDFSWLEHKSLSYIIVDLRRSPS
jgi:hypothetical protein